MTYVDAGGVRLSLEETGAGIPIVFVHEFSGDLRSWEPQVRFFARRYRCITYNARGYPPSDVPTEESAYSQQRAVDDILAVLDHLEIERSHIVGLSMGAFATLHFGLQYPHRARSLVVAGCGYGVTRDAEVMRRWEQDVADLARKFADDIAAAAALHASAVGRMPFKRKDPRGWVEFAEQLAGHSPVGSALTLLGVQQKRPSLYEMESALRALTVPTLILHGDEDDQCLEPGVYLKRVIPSAALQVLPKTGHTANLEDPDLFNRAVLDLLTTVDAGRWEVRTDGGALDTLGLSETTGVHGR